MNMIEYPDRDMAALGLADRMAGELKTALSAAGKATLAVPGGTTPGPVFDALSAVPLDWKNVTVMLTDERWVPTDHERSNAGLVRERLLQGPASDATFLPFYRSDASVEESVPRLSTEVESLLPLSVAVLGMGADMHTASLFPGALGLLAALQPDAAALCAIRADSQPDPRITLSARVLNSAMTKHLIIFGEDKKQALQTAIGLPHEVAPVAAVIEEEGTVHWAP